MAMSTEPSKPSLIFVLSGKRKSGKDYIGNRLQTRLGPDRTVIIRLSGPLKQQYAQEHGLDFAKLLDASSYKETHREDMIRWGEEIRSTDPGYFCRHAIEQSHAWEKDVWIVSDARRNTDLQYFRDEFGPRVKTVRVVANDDVRQCRGWVFTKGIDDAESECGLDSYKEWDYYLSNNGHEKDVNTFLKEVLELMDSLLVKIDDSA